MTRKPGAHDALQPDAVIRRVELLDQPRQQVAAALGVSVHTVTVRLHRAQQAIKRAVLLSCTACPEHGFLRCTCDLPRRTTDAVGQAESHPP